MTHFILCAYELDGQKNDIITKAELASQKLKDETLAWVHLDGQHPETRTWLESELSYLDPHIVDALLAEETRPRMTEIEDGALMILRGVNLNASSDPEDMISIRLWIDQQRIITVQRRTLKSISDIEESIKRGKGPKSAGDFITKLVSYLTDHIETALIDLDDMTDQTEENVIDGASASLRESITLIRRKAIMFRRYIAPQREALSQLRLSDLSWLTDKEKRHLQENHNHITRYVEDLDAIRERAQIIKDELVSSMSDRLNKNMYILSIISAIFLPLGFLTGLLGINVGGIPGSDNDNAFVIFSVILLLLIAVELYLFKKLKWL